MTHSHSCHLKIHENGSLLDRCPQQGEPVIVGRLKKEQGHNHRISRELAETRYTKSATQCKSDSYHNDIHHYINEYH